MIESGEPGRTPALLIPAILLVVLVSARGGSTCQAPTGATAAPSLQGEVAVGFGGYFRPGECTPLKVRLANRGPDISGEVRVDLSGSSFSHAVSLPSPSRKTLSLYAVPTKDEHSLRVHLWSGKRVIASFTSEMRRLGDDELLALVSSTLRPDLRSTGQEEGRKQRRVFLDPADFPEEWREYDAADSVTLDSSDPARLGPAQRLALSRWTLLGGTVTILHGDRVGARPDGSRDARAQTRNPLGLGSFGIVGGSTPFDGKATPGYRASLLDIDQEVFESARIQEPVSRHPIFWLVSGFVLTYFVAVAWWPAAAGTSVRGVPWKMGAIPLIVLLFSTLSLGLGRVIDGGKLQVRQNRLIHVFPNTSDTYATSALDVLPARRGAVRLAAAKPASYLFHHPYVDVDPGCRYEFAGGTGPSAVLDLSLWRARRLSLASFSDKGRFLSLRGLDHVRLVNRSGSPLRDCSLVRSGTLVPVGEIGPGQERRLQPQSSPEPDAAGVGPQAGRGILPRALSIYGRDSAVGVVDDCVICRIDEVDPELSTDDAPVAYGGSTAVVFHLGSRPAPSDGPEGK